MRKKLILIEDEYTIAMDIQIRLEELGYEILAIGDSFTEAIQLVADYDPDAVVMDIHIEGEKTGVEAAKIIQESFDVPVVFLTAHADTLTFETALNIKPYGYVLKPFKTVQLKNAIELAFVNHKAFQNQQLELVLLKEGLQKIEKNNTENDAVFIKDNGQLNRVFIKDIVRLQAMDNYTLIFTEKTKHIVGQFLKDVFKHLPSDQFLRVHRSHVVNITKIQNIDGNLLFIQKEGIPISKSHKTELMARLKVI